MEYIMMRGDKAVSTPFFTKYILSWQKANVNKIFAFSFFSYCFFTVSEDPKIFTSFLLIFFYR